MRNNIKSYFGAFLQQEEQKQNNLILIGMFGGLCYYQLIISYKQRFKYLIPPSKENEKLGQKYELSDVVKIEQLDPSSSNFQLHFQIAEIVNRNGDKLVCRIVDDTGIVNAYFHRYAAKLDKGGVYLMTSLRCALAEDCLRVEMSDHTVVSKEPDIIGFKDKSNDISKKFHKKQQPTSRQQHLTAPSNQVKKANTDILSSTVKKQQTLIPFTKQQAIQQLKIGRQFEQQLKQYYEPRDKAKEPTESTAQKDKHKTEHKTEKQKHLQYKQKSQSKLDKGKLGKDKDDRGDVKGGYREKQEHKQGRIYKANSVVYKEKETEVKKEQKNNNKNRGKKQEHKYKEIQKLPEKINKYKLKQDQKKPIEAKSELKYQTAGNDHKIESNGVVQQQTKKTVQTKKEEAQKQTEKKESQCIDIAEAVGHVGNYVNLKVWVTQKTRKNESSEEIDRLIADNSGSVWMKTSKMNLQTKEAYQIDNLQVCKEDQKILLRESQISEARRLETTISFNLKEINNKQ